MNIVALILDLDGTVLDTESIDRRVWPAAAAHCGYTLDDLFYLTLIGRTNRDSEAALARRFGVHFPLERFRERCLTLWQEQAAAFGVAVKEGVPELLAFADEVHLPVAIATSGLRENVDRKLRAAGLEGRFRHVVTGTDVRHGKPAPDIYLEAARRLGVAPSSCLAVEDSDPGALSASAAGMTVLIIPDLKPPSPEARQAAFCVLESLHQVPPLLSLWRNTDQANR